MNGPAVRIAATLLAVALGIWAGAKLYSLQSGARHDRGVRSAAGESSAPAPSELDDVLEAPSQQPKIPDRLPQFSLEDRSGRMTPIAAFAGKALIINFWATWCAPCRSEMPLLQALSAEWANRDTVVVGIAVDHRDKVVEFADRYKIGYPILIGEQDALDAAAAFGVGSPVFPFTVFTDRRGDVVALYIGELHREQAELILGKVHELDRDLTQLGEARRAITEGLRALRDKRKG
jgi:thiol-disulfide isomerase/thioredoxin